jgi:pyruvate,water dikinase
MAVLVQQMVLASASGVAFTADPVTGDRNVVRVSAIKGLGERLVSMAADADEWEVRANRATQLRAPEQALSGEQAREVARLARRVEAHFGGVPQDIEWAYSAVGRLHLLQARPITALPEKLAFTAQAPGGWARDFRFGEWLGEPLTPLFADWGIAGLEQSFWRELTVRVALPPPRPTHVVVHGWYFGSVSFWPDGLARTLLTTVGRPRMFRVFCQGAPLLMEWATRPWIEAWREDWLPDLERTVAAAAARLDEPGKLPTAPESMALIDELLRATGRYFVAIALVAGVGYKSELPLAQFYARHVRRRSGGSHQELLVGLGALETVRAHAVTSLDWAHPILDGEAIAQALQVAEQRREGIDRRRGEAEAQALESLKGRRRRRLARLIATARRFARMREEVVASLTLGYPALRRLLLGIGRSLVERGLLGDEADVLFLGRPDLERALGGATSTADLDRVVQENRRLWQRRRRLSAPLQLGTIPRIWTIYQRMNNKAIRGPAALASATGTRTGVRGIPASPGTATGPARIVRAPDEFARVVEGDVLIAPATAPAWTVLFARVAAVVTDTGSPMAHASLVAREFGIPAVVGTGDATERFGDGELVTVDGRTGIVSSHLMD